MYHRRKFSRFAGVGNFVRRNRAELKERFSDYQGGVKEVRFALDDILDVKLERIFKARRADEFG